MRTVEGAGSYTAIDDGDQQHAEVVADSHHTRSVLGRQGVQV